jgi:hypothetical protein
MSYKIANVTLSYFVNILAPSTNPSSTATIQTMKPPPAKLPDPWLFDSEALLRELDRCRETALQIPTNGDYNATHFGIQITVNALWTLRENIRYLLHLHREGQRAIRKQHEQSLAQALSKPASGNAQILHLRPSAPSNSHALKTVKSRAASRREAVAKRRRPPFSVSHNDHRVA